MIEGELDATKMSNGQWRFRYVTPGGAEYLGPKLYKTKSGALSAGNKWLAEQLK